MDESKLKLSKKGYAFKKSWGNDYFNIIEVEFDGVGMFYNGKKIAELEEGADKDVRCKNIGITFDSVQENVYLTKQPLMEFIEEIIESRKTDLSMLEEILSKNK